MKCPRCEKEKPLEDFPSRGRTRHGDKRYGYCRSCHAEYQRVNKLKNLFSLTTDEYDRVVEYQGGVCAACRRPPKSTRLAVDHDHKTGLVRGGLCWLCNKTLGMVRDDAALLERMAAYLRDPPAVHALGAPRYGRVGRVTTKSRFKRAA